jgi:hypothetical protein
LRSNKNWEEEKEGGKEGGRGRGRRGEEEGEEGRGNRGMRDPLHLSLHDNIL